MKVFSLLVVAVSLFGISCERHEFEGPDGTKQLHEHHVKPEPGKMDEHAESAH